MKIIVKVVLLLLVLFAGNAMASTCTAKAGNQNWNYSGAWTGCGVPGDGDSVVIPSTSTVTLNADSKKISNLTNNGTFNAGSDTLKLDGNFSNTGTFNAQTGKVEFDGNAAQTISGNVTFNDLKVDNGSSNGLILNGNVIVNGELSGNAAPGGLVKLSDTCPDDYTLTSNNGNTVQHSCPPPPGPIAEYRFEETAGTVADSSGNGLNGSRIGGVAVGGSGKICNGYKFNGSNAFVSVPHSTLLNQSKITVMAWMRHSAAPSKSWEAIVTKGDSAYRLHLNGGCSINGVNTQGGLSLGINGGCDGADINSGTVPVAGTWYHAAGTYDGATIKIFVNGVLLASRAYADSIDLNVAALNIGQNAGQPIGRFFNGDIDEVKIYSGALTAAQISAGYANENAGKNWDGTARACAASGPDHYELSLPTTGISCLPTTVTVTACATGVPCNPMTTLSGKTALLTSNAGALTSATVTFDALGVASTTLSYPAASDGAVATVTLSGEQVAAINARQSCPDGANCAVGNSGSTIFKTAGFVFSNAVNAAEATFSSQSAGVDFGPYWLRSVKTNTATKACEAALTAPHPVTFSYQCLDPASCSIGNWLKIGSSSLPSSGATINLAFDANGNASLGNFNFADVGQIQINASATAGGATLIGSTKEAVGSNFVVKPYSLVLTDIKQTASPSLANPAAPDAAGNKFVKAGESFSATVTSVNASCGASLSSYTLLSSIAVTCITPNFGKEAAPESVALSNALVPGLGLSANPALANATAFAAFAEGSATGTTFSWGEVGIITLTPSVGDGNYLGAGDATGTPSANVGRFYPDHFETTLTQGCSSSFTYSGQPFPLRVVAYRVGGAGAAGITANYSSTGFAKVTTISGVGATGNVAGGDEVGQPSKFAPSNFSSGATPALTDSLVLKPNFSFDPRKTAATTVTIKAIDTDGVSSASGVEGASHIRYGRVRIRNAYGSERLDLPITLRAQYWNGSGWVQNINDNCTGDVSPLPLSAANVVSVTLKDPVTLADSALTCVWDSGEPGRSGRGCPSPGPTLPINKPFRKGATMVTGPAPMQKGDFNLWLQKPTGPGSVVVTVDVPTWLEFNWTGAVGDPSARATFGTYRSPLIYRRENY